MVVSADVKIQGTRAAVWSLITDVARWPAVIKGVQKIEVTGQPVSGLSGLRWKETRLLFDKPETVEKAVTEWADQQSYSTQAEQDGYRFTTTLHLADQASGVVLTSTHVTQPLTLAARLKSLPLFLFKGVIRKTLREDLVDIKKAVEGH